MRSSFPRITIGKLCTSWAVLIACTLSISTGTSSPINFTTLITSSAQKNPRDVSGKHSPMTNWADDLRSIVKSTTSTSKNQKISLSSKTYPGVSKKKRKRHPISSSTRSRLKFKRRSASSQTRRRSSETWSKSTIWFLDASPCLNRRRLWWTRTRCRRQDPKQVKVRSIKPLSINHSWQTLRCSVS